MNHPEPLSGPDQLMHLELLIATLRHCQETGEQFVLDDTHPLRQHVLAVGRQRALRMIQTTGRRIRDRIAFDEIVDNL